jgi:hypothetical protein
VLGVKWNKDVARMAAAFQIVGRTAHRVIEGELRLRKRKN